MPTNKISGILGFGPFCLYYFQVRQKIPWNAVASGYTKQGNATIQ